MFTYKICAAWLMVITHTLGFAAESPLPSTPKATTAKTTTVLTVESVVQLSQQRTLELQLSQLQGDMAQVRAQVAGARRSGLAVDFDGAYRSQGDEQNDYGLRVRQQLELWKRASRIESAAAALQEQTARTQLVRMYMTADNLRIFYRALYAKEKAQLAVRSVQLHKHILDSSHARFRAGTIGELDLNIARIAHARSQSAHTRAEVELHTHIATLRKQFNIALDTDIDLDAQLSWTVRDHNKNSRTELTELTRQPTHWDFSNHPQLTLLHAQLQTAQAQISTAQAAGKPDIAISAGYDREEGADIASIGLSLDFAVGARSDALQQQAQLQLQSAELQYQRKKHSLHIQCTTLWQQYNSLHKAYNNYSAAALSAFDNNNKLAQRSYQAGQIAIGSLLTIRRELLEAQAEQLTLQLALSNAALDLSLAAALPPFAHATE